jgi:hypothetical protein
MNLIKNKKIENEAYNFFSPTFSLVSFLKSGQDVNHRHRTRKKKFTPKI